MRYTFLEPILTTVTDETVPAESVRELLLSLNRQGHYVEIGYTDAETTLTLNYPKARITAVHADAIDIHAFNASASFRIRNIPIANVQRIRVIATKQDMSKKYKVTRWQLLDVAEVAE